MKNEIEFFSTNQKDMFISMCNGLINSFNTINNVNVPKIKNVGDIYKNKTMPSGLNALCRKSEHIIFSKGDPLSIKTMFERILKGQKHWGRPPYSYESGTPEECYIGFGHFRWDNDVIVLTDQELKALKAYLRNSKTEIATTSFKFKGLLISSQLFNCGVSFPNDKSELLHNQFKVTIINESNNKKAKFDFFGSYNDHVNGIVELRNEQLLEAFDCFINDAISAEEDFENWCENFGYDYDSRRAHKIYKECLKSLDKAKNIINGDIYEFAEELREAVEN